MITKRIIACLDVRDGRVVKGVQFVDLIDAGDPATQAARHAREGADEIVLLDITATHEGRQTLLDTVRRTARELFVPFCVGGGIRSADDAAQVFEAGADKVSVNSAALADPMLIDAIGRSFGAQAVVVAIDARRDPEAADPVRDAQVLAFAESDVRGIEVLHGTDKISLVRTDVAWKIAAPVAAAVVSDAMPAPPSTPCAQLRACRTSGASVRRRPPNTSAEIGTPFGASASFV